MKRLRHLLPVCLLIYLSGGLLACNLFFFPDYDEIEYFPSGSYDLLPEGRFPTISFDFGVDRYSVEDIFSVSDFEGKLEGRYSWEKRNVSFLPDEGFIPGRRYSLVFSGKFLDDKGRTYTVSKTIVFFYAAEEGSVPAITEIIPAPGSTISGESQLSFRFSVPMDDTSVAEGLDITPSIAYQHSWQEDDTLLLIVPEDEWENLTLYHITIDEDLTDSRGVPYPAESQFSFFVDDDDDAPTILYVSVAENSWTAASPFAVLSEDLNDLRYHDAIRIGFSETMDQDSVEEGFSISPNCPGTTFWIADPSAEYPDRNALVFIPEQGYTMGQEYLLEIEEEVTDEHQIPMGIDVKKTFTPNIPLLELSAIEGVAPGNSFSLTSYSSNRAQSIGSSEPSPFDYTFRFRFSRPFAQVEEKAAVQEKISIAEIFSSSGSPSPAAYSWQDDYTLTATYTNFRSSSSGEHYYLMTIAGGSSGIVNSEGSFLSQSIEQLLVVPKP